VKVGDLVKRHSTGDVSLVIDVVMGCMPSNPLKEAPWIMTFGSIPSPVSPIGLRFHELYEVISESR
jgi:hypothetical protein